MCSFDLTHYLGQKNCCCTSVQVGIWQREESITRRYLKAHLDQRRLVGVEVIDFEKVKVGDLAKMIRTRNVLGEDGPAEQTGKYTGKFTSSFTSSSPGPDSANNG